MPVQLFTKAERARRNRFPEIITYEDLVTFFTLTARDLDSIPRYSAPHNRIGYALQRCTLRFMGFVPDDLTSAPPAAVAFLAQQLTVEPDVLTAYGARAQTRQDHLRAAQVHLGYRKVGREDLKALADWLLERALEHDKPTVLYELTCEKLRTDQLVRPGLTRLERLVAEARVRAETETFRQLTPLLTADRRRWLDILLEPDPARGLTPLAWFDGRPSPTPHGPFWGTLKSSASYGAPRWTHGHWRRCIRTASSSWRSSRARRALRPCNGPHPRVGIPGWWRSCPRLSRM